MSTVQPVQFVADAYAEILSDAFALYGARPNVTWTLDTVTAPANVSDAEWWKQPLPVGERADVFVGAPETVCRAVALRSAPAGFDTANSEAVRIAFGEFVQQTLADLCRTLGSLTGNQLLGPACHEIAPPNNLALLLSLAIRCQEEDISPLYLGCTSGFLSAIHLALNCASEKKTPGNRAGIESSGSEHRFDMLLDIEMPVSVSFGKSTLPLKDVMKLTVGSIVELNRRQAEPVDLIINNCIVARGEVVVVEGSYGLRLLEVIGQGERMSIR